MRPSVLAVSTAVAALAAAALPPTALAAPDPALAEELFAEAEAICRADDGAMWGVSLCGPMLVVDHMDRRVIANAPDAEGLLEAEGDRYVGTLPGHVVVANTPTEWAGVRWTQLVAIVPDAPGQRRVLIAHELFHRVQPTLGLARDEADNSHLDTPEGRYLLQLEWRALARALESAGAERTAATADALAFRRERHRRFPGSEASEAALDTSEGIPEYTGVMLGLDTPAERTAYALHDLRAFVDAPSFVRSFAYAHGPAYGLLLEEVAPGWHRDAAEGPSPQALLEQRLDLAQHAQESVEVRARRYDGERLRAAEDARERERQARLAGYRQRLVEGPVLVLPMDRANLRFNPQTLVPLPDLGTVYPTLQLVDRWGSLEVEDGGALVRREPKQATVAAAGLDPSTLAGTGWRLTLEEGWTLRPGARAGDWTVACEGTGCAGAEDRASDPDTGPDR